jgi:hypothetical protein
VEDRKLIYGPEDSLDPNLFLERVFNGAVPAKDMPEARSAAALQRRFLSAQGLRLVGDPSVIRASILRAVQQGVLAVRQDDGAAFDKGGAVHTTNGLRQRDVGRKLTTLPMDEATLVAELGSALAKEWLGVSDPAQKPPENGQFPLPPPPLQGAGPTSTTDINAAADLADKRRLISMRVSCASAADAQKILGAAAPLGAPSTTFEAELAGEMKDGGKLMFRVVDAKMSAAIKPLTLAQTLGNSLAAGATIKVIVALGFGADGKADLGALLRGLALQLPEGATVEAQFAALAS